MAGPDRPLISNENLQTVVAVCFVLSLLSVAFNFYNFTRVQRTEKLSSGMRESGEPLPQLKSISSSLRANRGLSSRCWCVVSARCERLAAGSPHPRRLRQWPASAPRGRAVRSRARRN